MYSYAQMTGALRQYGSSEPSNGIERRYPRLPLVAEWPAQLDWRAVIHYRTSVSWQPAAGVGMRDVVSDGDMHLAHPED